MTSSSGFEVESVVGKLSMREQRVARFMSLMSRSEMRREDLIVEAEYSVESEEGVICGGENISSGLGGGETGAAD